VLLALHLDVSVLRVFFFLLFSPPLLVPKYKGATPSSFRPCFWRELAPEPPPMFRISVNRFQPSTQYGHATHGNPPVSSFVVVLSVTFHAYLQSIRMLDRTPLRQEVKCWSSVFLFQFFSTLREILFIPVVFSHLFLVFLLPPVLCSYPLTPGPL